MPSRKKKMISVYLEPATIDQLRKISKRTSVPVAAMIRQAVEKFVQLKRKK